jgi:NADH-quinone oxidoreductase subunit N
MKELVTLSLTGIFIMLAEMMNLRKLSFPLALMGLATTIYFCIFDWGISQNIYKMMTFDQYAQAFTLVMCITALLWLVMSEAYFDRMGSATDRYALVMFILVGGLTMIAYSNLVMLFIGIEILSVSLYVLAGSQKNDLNSNEAAFKYFLMGAFASGFLLFGIALIYGVTGTFDVEQIRLTLAAKSAQEGTNAMLIVGSLMLLIGLGFKVSAAPFHFWAPDVYQGSPTPITALMATIVKISAFAAMYRLFTQYLGSTMTNGWDDIVVGMIVLSLLISNISAVVQHDAKRMLAYSSISHAGYMLIALLCANGQSDNSIVFYTAVYSVATIVAFMVLQLVSEKSGSTDITAFNGLGKSNPLMAVAMTISLLSMAGIPPLAGFMAKYYIFANAMQEGYWGLILFAISMSLVGVYYYFRIIIAMFLGENRDTGAVKINPLQNALLIFGCIALLVLGILPQLVYGLL